MSSFTCMTAGICGKNESQELFPDAMVEIDAGNVATVATAFKTCCKVYGRVVENQDNF